MGWMVARAMLTLGRGRASGVLRVRAGQHTASMAISEGRLASVEFGTGPEPLSERISREAGPDARKRDEGLSSDSSRRADTADGPGSRERRHERGLGPIPRERSREGLPLGERLVAMGATTEEALSRALREQMMHRVRLVLSWRDPSCRFSRESVHVKDAPTIVDVVLAVARAEHVASEPCHDAVLTRVGDALISVATLSPTEAAVAAALRRQCTVAEALGPTDSCVEGRRFVGALASLGGLGPSKIAGRRHSVLLQKRFALRRGASDHAILDLPTDARPRAARGALRRLARAIHPDHFERGTPASIRRISGEVMAELVEAERRIAKAG